jgi:hypothetical protein
LKERGNNNNNKKEKLYDGPLLLVVIHFFSFLFLSNEHQSGHFVGIRIIGHNDENCEL